MNWLDYLLIGIISFSALISLIRGFVKEALSLVIWFCAFFVASQLYPQLSSYLTQIKDEMFRNGAAIAILFIATLMLGAILNFIIGQLVNKTGLSGTDRLLGVVFGAIRGVLMVAAILFFVDTFTQLPQMNEWKQSQLIPHFKPIIQWFFEYLEKSSSFLPKMP